MLLLLVIRMDVIRWTEYIAIQWILFSFNALVHVSTTYPDAGGYQSSCIDPRKHVAGAWMWHWLSTAYCGDMMWSGHTQGVTRAHNPLPNAPLASPFLSPPASCSSFTSSHHPYHSLLCLFSLYLSRLRSPQRP